MKKALMIALALLISVAFVTTVFAQAKPAEKPAAAPEKAAPAKADKPAKAAPAKAKVMKFAGEVVSVDAAAKTFVAKSKKGEMTFDAANAKFAKGTKFEDMKAGDKVAVKYEEKDGKNVASAIAKATPKAKKPAPKKEEAPAAEKKAEPAKPATPAAPAKK